MQLKGNRSALVTITTDGKISIEQYSSFLNKVVEIHLTLDQFELLGKYVLNNISDIEMLWNDGVENDSNS